MSQYRSSKDQLASSSDEDDDDESQDKESTSEAAFSGTSEGSHEEEEAWPPMKSPRPEHNPDPHGQNCSKPASVYGSRRLSQDEMKERNDQIKEFQGILEDLQWKVGSPGSSATASCRRASCKHEGHHHQVKKSTFHKMLCWRHFIAACLVATMSVFVTLAFVSGCHSVEDVVRLGKALTGLSYTQSNNNTTTATNPDTP